MVGSLDAAQPAQENRTHVRPRGESKHPLPDLTMSIGQPVPHNSAVLLCRLRCISRADQIVLRPMSFRKMQHTS